MAARAATPVELTLREGVVVAMDRVVPAPPWARRVQALAARDRGGPRRAVEEQPPPREATRARRANSIPTRSVPTVRPAPAPP
jgi:hypothetical protein